MQTRQFGSTGLFVSPLALGTVNISWLTDEADSFAMLDRAFEVGVNLIDTADSYNGGKAEALLGRWFAQGGGRREKTVLASKVYLPPTEWGSPDPMLRSGAWVGPNQRRLSAKHIREACDASLQRLGVDYIDLYQMHHIDRNTGWDEIWQAMDVLIQQGKILYVGSSNFAGWQIAQARETAKRRDMVGPVSEQSIYNLTKRTVELEVLPAARAYGMGFLAYHPLQSGLLAGPPAEGANQGRRSRRQSYDAVDAFVDFCKSVGRAPAQVALTWLAQRPGVTPIVGPRTMAQFEESIAAVEATFDQESLMRLDALFPGPGGAAPEAYAW